MSNTLTSLICPSCGAPATIWQCTHGEICAFCGVAVVPIDQPKFSFELPTGRSLNIPPSTKAGTVGSRNQAVPDDIAIALLVQNYAEADQLIAAGANINGEVSSSVTGQVGVPLLLAIILSKSPEPHWYEAIEYLLRKGASPDCDFSLPEHGSVTALGLASLIGNVALLKLLLKYRADPNKGQSAPLFLAVHQQNPAFIDILLAAGTVPDSAGLSSGKVVTALTLAVQMGARQMVETLLRARASPRWRPKDHPEGVSPLYCAVQNEDEAMVRLLLRCGAWDDAAPGAPISRLVQWCSDPKRGSNWISRLRKALVGGFDIVTSECDPIELSANPSATFLAATVLMLEATPVGKIPNIKAHDRRMKSMRRLCHVLVPLPLWLEFLVWIAGTLATCWLLALLSLPLFVWILFLVVFFSPVLIFSKEGRLFRLMWPVVLGPLVAACNRIYCRRKIAAFLATPDFNL